jgi:hypothetical protein
MILLHFSHLSPTQIHNHAYNLVGINSEKTGFKLKWHNLHFTQHKGIYNNDLELKCEFYIKLW